MCGVLDASYITAVRLNNYLIHLLNASFLHYLFRRLLAIFSHAELKSLNKVRQPFFLFHIRRARSHYQKNM
jgi:hypothetical protein